MFRKSAQETLVGHSCRSECHIPFGKLCGTGMSHKSLLQDCFARISQKSECHARCSTRVRKSVPQSFPNGMCPTGMSHKSLLQDCFARISQKSECHARCSTRVTRVSHKAFRMECVLQECPTRVSHKTVSREFRRRVSVMQDVPQECTRVSHKAFRMECVLQAKFSHKSLYK